MELTQFLSALTPAQKAEIATIVDEALPDWAPLPGQQTMAFESEADEVYYGGAAGGAKSDLLLGMGLTQHHTSIVYRREATQLEGLTRRLIEMLGSNKGWNDSKHILKRQGKILEFGSCKDAGDEVSYQGRPHDFIGFDEIPHFLKSQYKFLIGWNRTTRPGQRCRVVCTGNPPTDTEGRWVIEYWAPWLDPNHPNPALPGELRWFTTIDSKDVELPNGDPVLVEGVMVQPRSRTFIPSKITDNPFLMATGYMSTLQALPEPLRSQMLKGDFLAGVTDDAWQIFPTAWVDAAMARWSPEGKKGRMSSAGVDVARGGTDHTIVATRYDTWYDELKKFPGSETPNGAVTAGLVISVIRDGAPVHVDALGVGGETVGHLESNEVHTVAIEGYNTELCKDQTDRGSGRLRFRNYRAMIHWRFREALDPMFGMSVDPRHPDYRAPVALPPDQKLKSDLCSIKWKMTAGGILVESKEDIKKRIGRSPDDSDSVIYCWIDTPKRAPKQQGSNWRAHKAKGSWRAQ